MILEFIQRLKALGRYDDALIVIQSDHGGRFRLRNREPYAVTIDNPRERIDLEYSASRADALLLIKPPRGLGGERPYRRSPVPARLIDVAPTILDLLAIEPPSEYAGISLANPGLVDDPAPQLYHWYEWEDDELVVTRWDFSPGKPPSRQRILEAQMWKTDDPGEQPDEPNASNPFAGLKDMSPETLEHLQNMTREEIQALRRMNPEQAEWLRIYQRQTRAAQTEILPPGQSSARDNATEN